MQESDQNEDNERPDQPILNFEQKLMDPMIPDLAQTAIKVQQKFPDMVRRFGGALVFFLVIMYAAVGLNGLLIFFFGVTFLGAFQFAIVCRYIVNENARAKEFRLQKEREQREAEETVDEQFDMLEAAPDAAAFVEEVRRPKSAQAGNEGSRLARVTHARKSQFSRMASIGESVQTELLVRGDRRARANSDPDSQSLVADTANQEGAISQDQAPPISVDEQGSPIFGRQFKESDKSVVSLQSRKIKRPAFLEQCFDEPEQFDFFMFHVCQCRERRINEIKLAFLGKQKGVADGLRTFTTFMQLFTTSKEEYSKALSATGQPTKSFLSSVTKSRLFDCEPQILNARIPEETTDPQANLLFCTIRANFARTAQAWAEQATDWRDFANIGPLSIQIRRLEELAASFTERYGELCTRVLAKCEQLHTKETEYKESEDKFIELIQQHRELVSNEDQVRPSEAAKADGASKVAAAGAKPARKSKTFNELVLLESQCKITHYQLNTLALELRDSYAEMTEAFEEEEAYRKDMVQQLRDLIAEQAGVLFKVLTRFFDEAKTAEIGTLKDFESMLTPKKSLPRSPIPKQETIVLTEEIDEEEGTLSDQEETPQVQTCERYSDIKRSSNLASSHGSSARRASNASRLIVTEEEKTAKALAPGASLDFGEGVTRTEGSIMVKEPDDDVPEPSPILVTQPLSSRNESSPEVMPFQTACEDLQPEASPKKAKIRQLCLDDISAESGGESGSILNISLTDVDVIGSKADQEQADASAEEVTSGLCVPMSPTRPSPLHEQYMDAKRKYVETQQQLNELYLTVEELAKYFKDLAALHLAHSMSLTKAIESQFRVIRTVKTGGSLDLEKLDQVDQEKIMKTSMLAMKKTESKKYEESGARILFKSDFGALVKMIEVYLGEQRVSADLFETCAQLLDNAGAEVGKFLTPSKVALEVQIKTAAEQATSIEKLQHQIDSTKNKIKAQEELERQKKLEEERAQKELLAEELIDPDPTPETPHLFASKRREIKIGTLLRPGNSEIGSHLSIPTIPERKEVTPVARGQKLHLSQLLSKQDPPRHQSSTFQMKREFSGFTQLADQESEMAIPESARGRSHSYDNLNTLFQSAETPKNWSRKQSQISLIDLQGAAGEIRGGMADGIQIDEALQCKKSFHGRSQSQEHQTAEQKQAEVNAAEGGEDTGIGYYFRNFLSSVFISSAETKSKAELIEQLAQEEASLKSQMQGYIKSLKKSQREFRGSRERLQRQILDWKKILVNFQINRIRQMLAQINSNDACKEIDPQTHLAKTRVELQIKGAMFVLQDKVSFHEPHCPNYALFKDMKVPQAADPANPFRINLERAQLLEHSEESKAEARSDNNSNASTLNDGRSSLARSSITKKSPSLYHIDTEKEPCMWVNDLLAVFYEAWQDAKVFHRMVLDGIYTAVNFERDASLAEIKCIAMRLEGKPPRINWVKNLVMHPSSTAMRPCFTIEGDCQVPGKVKIMVQTAYKINWPAENWYSIPLTLEIIVSRIRGHLRLQFSNDDELHGGSYMQFVGQPSIQVDVEPVIFTESQINLKSFPTVKSLLKDIINQVIIGLCFPNRVPMSVPCTAEAIYLDEDGQPIQPKKQRPSTA